MGILSLHRRPITRNPQLCVYLTVKNIEKSVDFYARAFGFTRASESSATQKSRILAYEDRPFLLLSEDAGRSTARASTLGQKKSDLFTIAKVSTYSPTTITVLCRNIPAMYEKAIQAGACSIQSPFTMSNGTKTFLVSELEDYIWRFMDDSVIQAAASDRLSSKLLRPQIIK